MITAREKGRSLELIVGGGDDSLSFVVPPVSAKIGAAMLADWVGIAFGAVPLDEAPEKMTSVARQALGTEVYEQITDLRWGEQEDLVNCAFMWNVQGGGIDLCTLYLEGGLPKAREHLLERVGMSEAWALLQASLAGASADLMSTVASNGTSTPPGIAESSSAPAG